MLLITQGYDDHCHVKTLEPLSRMFPDLEVISTPNAEDILSKFFKKVLCLCLILRTVILKEFMEYL
jgi:hypothetical protein